MSFLKIENIVHKYDKEIILNGVDFSLDTGEILCILGPSGCGKTTLLHCISGFEDLLEGSIIFNEEVISKGNTTLSPEKRNMSLVFQDYALFPHMSVRKNIEFALKNKSNRLEKSLIKEVLSMVDLLDKIDNFPHELSGGEQQRVAIARSLASGNKLILLDEPFSNLDPNLRQGLRYELRKLLKKNAISAIFITHDQFEAFDMADRIAILNKGKIEQLDTPKELYQNPKNSFVANFLGSKNLIQTTYNNENAAYSCPLFSIETDELNQENVFFYIPNNAIHLEESDLQSVNFNVISEHFRGDNIQLVLEYEDIKMSISRPSSSVHIINNRLKIFFNKKLIKVIPA